jgi:hypothetical protein
VIDVDLKEFDVQRLHDVHANLKYFRLNTSAENLKLFNQLLNANYKNNIINYNEQFITFKLIGDLFVYNNFDVFICDRRYYLPSVYLGFKTGVYKGRSILFGERVSEDFWAISSTKINRDCYIGDENSFINDLIIIDKNQVKFNENAINIYIYDLMLTNDTLSIKVFEYGYVNANETVEVSSNFKKVPNEDYTLYSKMSSDYSQNFFTYKFNVCENQLITFTNSEYEVRLHAVKNAFNYVFKDNKTVLISNNQIEYKVNQQLEEKYKDLINPKYNNVILFQDRNHQAGDNAEALYRYVLNNKLLGQYDCYFVLDENSSDYQRLEKEGFKLIDFGSELHKQMYVNCQMICSSHAAKRIYSPFYNRNYEMITRYKFVFLQHGIIMGNHQGFLDVLNNKIDLFITSTKNEQTLVQEFSKYNNVVNTGLARFDRLVNNDLDYILYAPSWNVLYRQDFVNGDYFKEIVNVLSLCSEKNINIKLLLHPEFINYHHYFNDYIDQYVEVIEPGFVDYHFYLTTCSALITDYSSILWDVLYLEKQLFLHKPYDLHHQNDMNDEYIDYGIESFNIQELRMNIDKYKVYNQNPIFNRDKNCSKRIINEVNKILKGD